MTTAKFESNTYTIYDSVKISKSNYHEHNFFKTPKNYYKNGYNLVSVLTDSKLNVGLFHLNEIRFQYIQDSMITNENVKDIVSFLRKGFFNLFAYTDLLIKLQLLEFFIEASVCNINLFEDHLSIVNTPFLLCGSYKLNVPIEILPDDIFSCKVISNYSSDFLYDKEIRISLKGSIYKNITV